MTQEMISISSHDLLFVLLIFVLGIIVGSGLTSYYDGKMLKDIKHEVTEFQFQNEGLVYGASANLTAPNLTKLGDIPNICRQFMNSTS